MKKLFILVSLVFSIFLVSDEVFALEYEVNGTTYQVSDLESFRDYCYYHYNKLPFLFVFNRGYGQYACYTSSNSSILKRWSNNNGNGLMGFPSPNNGLGISTDFSSVIFENLNSSSTSTNFSGYGYIYYSTIDVLNYSDNSLYQSANLNVSDIENKYSLPYYTITYYLNNEVYQEIEVQKGSSHTLLYYEPNSDYNFSGWDYGNANLSNIQSDITITGTTTPKPYYTISYYLNSELYNSVSVIEGTNYNLVDYVPPKNYQFSGWSYDSNIDLTNITQNVNIFGTSVYVRPEMTYNEESNSIIHNLSYDLLGNDVPVEFDYVYTLTDYLILLILVFCALVPFIIVFKLLNF